MDWFKKRSEAIATITAILGIGMWLHAQSTDFRKEVNVRFTEVDARFTAVEKEIAVIKTIMIMNGMMPASLAYIPEDSVSR